MYKKEISKKGKFLSLRLGMESEEMVPDMRSAMMQATGKINVTMKTSRSMCVICSNRIGARAVGNRTANKTYKYVAIKNG